MLFLACAVAGCAASPPRVSAAPAAPVTLQPASSSVHGSESSPQGTELATPEPLARDTSIATSEGATFIAPAGWRVTQRGPVTLLEAPEGDSHLAFVESHAKDADGAVAAAWAAYKPDATWPLQVSTDSPDRDGWTNRRFYGYQTSPNEKRDVAVDVQRAGEVWTAIISDLAESVADKRGSAIAGVFGRFLPKGYARESFAGKQANRLDAAHIARLTSWLQIAMMELGVPGASLGLVQDGKVLFADGFGVRELGKKQKPDGDTLYMIASNTKALTTLLLARMVDRKQITWDTPVTQLLPTFKLGDAEVTRQLRVRHLVCACTGLPRQDFEWLFQFKGVTPEGALATLATVRPTSKFGEMFQYSNLLAGAAGFVGAHVLFPKLELGAAYDTAIRTEVFEPLGMLATTFDYARALRGNHTSPHAPDVDGQPRLAPLNINYSMIPLRPAGAAWSNVHDMLAYVSMELAEGRLPTGEQYVGREALLERRVPQVAIGSDETYGMGLEVNTKYGIPVVHHGGNLRGYYSDMIWLPEQNVGAVILTNGAPGWILRSVFRRKLLEVLFDGRPEADSGVATQASAFYAALAAQRRLLTLPADPKETEHLAKRYVNDALGDITVSQRAGVTNFDFGEWQSEVATQKNPDGSVSFLTVTPGGAGFEFVVGSGLQRTLITRDDQHEYVFTERREPYRSER